MQPSIGNLALDLLLGRNQGNVLPLDGVIRLGADHHLGRHLGVSTDSGRVIEALVAGTARLDQVAQVSSVGGVLVVDLVPVAGNVTNAAADVDIVHANHTRFSEILHPASATIASGRVAVSVVFAAPDRVAAEGRLVLGEGVPVEAVGDFMDHGVDSGTVFKDQVAVGEGESGGAVV